MYPKQHAAISAVTALVVAVVIGVSIPTVVLWTVIGTLAGIFIDVDHVLLSMFVAGNREKGRYWFTHPIEAVTEPDALVESMEYSDMVYHRMVSHLAVFGVFYLLIDVNQLFMPVAAGLGAHIVGDLVWDVRNGFE